MRLPVLDVDRRWRATLEDSSVWNYDYNDRNELRSGKRSWSDATLVAGQQFEYAYGLIGNRASQPAGGKRERRGIQRGSAQVQEFGVKFGVNP